MKITNKEPRFALNIWFEKTRTIPVLLFKIEITRLQENHLQLGAVKSVGLKDMRVERLFDVPAYTQDERNTSEVGR